MDPIARLLAHLHDMPATAVTELAESVAAGGSLAPLAAGHVRRYAAVEPGLDAAVTVASTVEARAADLDGLDMATLILVEIHAPAAAARRLTVRLTD